MHNDGTSYTGEFITNIALFNGHCLLTPKAACLIFRPTALANCCAQLELTSSTNYPVAPFTSCKKLVGIEVRATTIDILPTTPLASVLRDRHHVSRRSVPGCSAVRAPVSDCYDVLSAGFRQNVQKGAALIHFLSAPDTEPLQTAWCQHIAFILFAADGAMSFPQC